MIAYVRTYTLTSPQLIIFRLIYRSSAKCWYVTSYSGSSASDPTAQTRRVQIGVTGIILDEDVIEYLAAGADMIMGKPVKLGLLLKNKASPNWTCSWSRMCTHSVWTEGEEIYDEWWWPRPMHTEHTHIHILGGLMVRMKYTICGIELDMILIVSSQGTMLLAL